MTSGILLQSSGRLRAVNCSFILLVTVLKNITIFYHSREGIRYSIVIENITISCPRNSRLKMFNTTIDIEKLSSPLFSRWLMFNDVIYICETCPTGQYSLQGGYLEQKTNPLRRKSSGDIIPLSSTETSKAAWSPSTVVQDLHSYIFTDVTCHLCPYGGTCHHGIQAKAIYWGLQQSGIVSFYKCPSGYCCSQVTCTTYNVCQNHRSGILCSKCKTGYSEVLFSPNCIPDEECKQFWFIPVAVLMLLIYTLFLMYQNDIKTFVFGSPMGTKTFQQWFSRGSQGNRKQRIDVRTQSQKDDNDTKFRDKDEGGIFLILIFYYFQDAAIVHFTPVYSKPTVPKVVKLKKFVGSLFKFQLDPLVFAGNLCPFAGLNPVTKVCFKFLSVPFLLFTLIIVNLISKVCCSRTSSTNLASKSTMALMLALLFSYQKLASSLFSLVYCVPLADDSVLFIDGSVKCLQYWQIVILIYIILCIVPFWPLYCDCAKLFK